jgi:general L-amino acid transport system permease protein
MASNINFVRTDEAPKLAPPANMVGWMASLREKLFATPTQGLASLVLGAFILWVAYSIVSWAIATAVWTGAGREACSAPGQGACWPFAIAKFQQWIYGFYPIEERWRVNVVYALGALTLAGLLMPSIPHKVWNAVFFFVVYPIVAYVLLAGGWFGLADVETTQWGGLLVTLVLSVIGIVASLPLGVLLALGRQSELPVVKMLCVGFIELVRGIPLITVLFMASVMFPLFMPPGVSFDKLLRAIVGVTLFSAAYMAEVVRGGLQAIPKGQYEAAKALGLPYWKLMGLIVMPQALRIVIPSIVNNFISLFMDTSLVSIIGIFDLTNIVKAGFNDPKWASPQTGNTGYFTAAVIYWIFCFAMSRYSLFVERRLNTGYKR